MLIVWERTRLRQVKRRNPRSRQATPTIQFSPAMAAYPIILPTILLICSVLYPHATASPTELFSRKSTVEDPYMVCDDPPPLDSLPYNYLDSWYPTTLALCSALNRAARNVGCVWFVLFFHFSSIHSPHEHPPFQKPASPQPATSTANNPPPTKSSTATGSPPPPSPAPASSP